LENYQSIFSRFSASILFNILRGVLTLATTVLLARFLGVENYGRMAFLLASFLAFKSLLDMSSSQAFFTFLSEKKRSKKFVNMYLCWMAFQLFFSLLLVGLILPDEVLEKVWINESRFLIILALTATFMQQSGWLVASQMAEAQRQTVKVQMLGTVIISINLVMILLLEYSDLLTLPILFTILTLEWFAGTFLAARMYVGLDDISDTFPSVVGEFWAYCKPLIPYMWLGALGEFLDRWMLQAWGGNAEQGYYAVATNIMIVVSIGVISIIRIMWKEIAEAYHQKNMDLVSSLYQRTNRSIYVCAAFFIGASIPWSSEILNTLLGSDYSAGSKTFMLMVVYTAHQSLGQVNGVLLLATKKVRLHAIIGSAAIIAGVASSYYILAPAEAVVPGLNMGSEGLAWKMVIINCVMVNVLMYVIAREFNWKYQWFYQFYVLGLAILVGYLVKNLVLGVFSSMYLSMVISLSLYTVAFGLLCYAFPMLTLGITKLKLLESLSKLSSKSKIFER
jgi:O-antigen/teichoic acid export membrane protein